MSRKTHDWALIHSLWMAGVSVSEICNRTGASPRSLRGQVSRLRKQGQSWPIHVNNYNRRKPGQPIREQASYWPDVRRLWDQGVTVREIAKAIDRSPSTVLGGIHYRRRAGEHWPFRKPGHQRLSRRMTGKA